MELRSEEKQEKESKGRKIIVAIIILLIALIIITAVAIALLQQKENEKTKLSVNGKSVDFSRITMIRDSNTGENYYSIKSVAQLVGYSFYNGGYKKYSEDKTKCYVECEAEVATLEENSNKIIKSNSKEKTNFTEYTTKKPVASHNGVLYINAEAVKIAFNTIVSIDKNTNTIIFNSLPYLANYYKTSVKSLGYSGISDDFNTQKSILYNMLVVKKDDKYGVISTSGTSVIIGNKYNNITYIDCTNEFVVTSDSQTGTLTAEGETKIGLRYDEIGLLDLKNGLYYAKSGKKYGVLNSNGKVLVRLEYDEIGIDRSYFPIANMDNDLFLFNNCIPLKRDGKWGIADKTRKHYCEHRVR